MCPLVGTGVRMTARAPGRQVAIRNGAPPITLLDLFRIPGGLGALAVSASVQITGATMVLLPVRRGRGSMMVCIGKEKRRLFVSGSSVDIPACR